MILITGGAGYIGSQIVQQLLDREEKVLVLDNLSSGSIEAVKNVPFIQGDVGDKSLLKSIFKENNIQAIMHLAAFTAVEESTKFPGKFFQNNTCQTLQLIDSCIEHHIPHFIFSSTAAVYGNEHRGKILETAACDPINPYGESKLMAEKIIARCCNNSHTRFVTLRYFNVAGADPALRVGPYQKKSTLLIRKAIQTAIGIEPNLMIFGDDYKTPDGTGIRDYIHVLDIANAHLLALAYLRHGGTSELFNVGYGHGYSVLEIVTALEKVLGHAIHKKIMPRREGDPEAIMASNEKIKTMLKWTPQYDSLEKILSDALQWEKKLFGIK